jgi:DNA-binding GntR family transcriptional regulator
VRGLRGALATEAYFALRRLIVEGTLPPQARLVETELSSMLALSRTPVRAALQRLHEEGLVQETEGRRQSRLFVAPLTREDATEIYLLLGEMDGLAAHYASELAADEREVLVERLRVLNEELRGSAHSGHPNGRRYFDLDDAFHGCYRDAVAPPRVRTLLGAIRPQADRYTHVYTELFASTEIPRSANDHDAIIDAIARGDPDAAHDAARRNYRNATARLLNIIGAQHG